MRNLRKVYRFTLYALYISLTAVLSSFLWAKKADYSQRSLPQVPTAAADLPPSPSPGDAPSDAPSPSPSPAPACDGTPSCF